MIVIGFGAKIWIQSPNLFQKFQQVWRQLHSLSIVDYPKLSMLTTLSRFFPPSKKWGGGMAPLAPLQMGIHDFGGGTDPLETGVWVWSPLRPTEIWKNVEINA